jgi:hypothetical protein
LILLNVFLELLGGVSLLMNWRMRKTFADEYLKRILQSNPFGVEAFMEMERGGF